MTATPKWLSIILNIPTRVTSLGYGNCIGWRVIFIKIPRRLSATVHYIVFAFFKQLFAINLLALNY